jgi:hypothetical protein
MWDCKFKNMEKKILSLGKIGYEIWKGKHSVLRLKIIATSMERGANTPNTRSIFHFPDILPP